MLSPIAPVPIPIRVDGQPFIATEEAGGVWARPFDKAKDWAHVTAYFECRCKGADTMADLRQAGESIKTWVGDAPPDVRLKCVDIYRAREAQLRR